MISLEKERETHQYSGVNHCPLWPGKKSCGCRGTVIRANYTLQIWKATLFCALLFGNTSWARRGEKRNDDLGGLEVRRGWLWLFVRCHKQRLAFLVDGCTKRITRFYAGRRCKVFTIHKMFLVQYDFGIYTFIEILVAESNEDPRCWLVDIRMEQYILNQSTGINLVFVYVKD